MPTLRAAAQAAMLLGHPDEARPLLNDAASVPSNDDAMRLAILREYLLVLAALDTPDAKTEHLRRADEALRLAPNDPDLLRARCDALARLGRTSDALALARQLTSSDGASGDDWLARAGLARAAGELVESAQALLAAARLGGAEATLAPEREATLKALRAERDGLAQRQQWTAALELVDVELTLRPGDRALLTAHARLLEAAGDHQQALAQAREIEAAARERGDWLDLCALYVSLGRASGAWACLERSGLMSGSQPRGDQAARVLTLLRAIARLPDVPAAVWSALARQAASANRDQVRAVLDDAARRFPNDAVLAQVRRELQPQIGQQGGISIAKQEILAKLKPIIAEQLGVDEADVTPETSFTEDLNADSLDLVELTMSVEEQFKLQIGDEDAEKIHFVGEAVDYIYDHLD